MASIKRRGDRWRALVFKNGVRDSATFPTRSEASDWGSRREIEIASGKVQTAKGTLRDAFRRYADQESPKKRGCRWEQIRLNMLARIMDFSDMPLKRVRPAHFAEWRNERLKKLNPATVRREMVLVRSVLEVARLEWGWISENPMQDVKKPSPPPHWSLWLSVTRLWTLWGTCRVQPLRQFSIALPWPSCWRWRRA
jgi:hypothetical protein